MRYPINMPPINIGFDVRVGAHRLRADQYAIACSSMTSTEKGTIAGAAVGGVAGSALTGGSALGTIGGAAAGGIIGHEVGENQDRRRR